MSIKAVVGLISVLGGRLWLHLVLICGKFGFEGQK